MTSKFLRLLPFFVVGLTATSFRSSAFGANLSELTANEFYGAAYFREAIEHPKIRGLQRTAQIRAVARDLAWKPSKLETAIAKVDSLRGDPAELAVGAIKSAASGTRLNGRMLDVLINADEPKHVVLYVRWQAHAAKDVVKDAATIASLVAKEAPLVSTLSLAATHPRSPKTSTEPVWSAKISQDSMGRIQAKRIDDYAERLYKGLFEGVEEHTF